MHGILYYLAVAAAAIPAVVASPVGDSHGMLVKRAGGKVYRLKGTKDEQTRTGCTPAQAKWLNKIMDEAKDVALLASKMQKDDPELETYFGPKAHGATITGSIKPNYKKIHDLLNTGAEGYENVIVLCLEAGDPGCRAPNYRRVYGTGKSKVGDPRFTDSINTIAFCPDFFHLGTRKKDIYTVGKSKKGGYIPQYTPANSFTPVSMCDLTNGYLENQFGTMFNRYPVADVIAIMSHVAKKSTQAVDAGITGVTDCVRDAFLTQWYAKFPGKHTLFNGDSYAAAATSIWWRTKCFAATGQPYPKALKQTTPDANTKVWTKQLANDPKAYPVCKVTDAKFDKQVKEWRTAKGPVASKGRPRTSSDSSPPPLTRDGSGSTLHLPALGTDRIVGSSHS